MAISAIQGIARRFIPAMIKQGLSQAAGLRMLQGQGLGYRKTKFLTDWREMAGTERKRDPLRAIPKKYRPTEATIQRTEYEQSKKFNYNYKIKGYDTIQQKDIDTAITVASDDLISMEEAMEEAKRLAEIYKIEIEIAEILIDGITVK